jgi:hypothetical protein
VAHDLRTTVEAQAAAHVSGDAARFASYMTPAAVLELGRTAEPARGITPRRYDVISVDDGGESGTSEVRFSGGGSYVVRETWQRGADGWKALSAERPPESIRLAWWKRMFGRSAPAPEERQELR